MRDIVVLLSAALLVGYAGSSRPGVISYKDFLAHNQANIQRISVGMPKGQVIDTMQTYSADTHDGAVANPLKSGYFTKGGDSFEVLYFVTEAHRPFIPVNDSQATPVVLKNGQVIGWGRRVLDDLK